MYLVRAPFGGREEMNDLSVRPGRRCYLCKHFVEDHGSMVADADYCKTCSENANLYSNFVEAEKDG